MWWFRGVSFLGCDGRRYDIGDADIGLRTFADAFLLGLAQGLPGIGALGIVSLRLLLGPFFLADHHSCRCFSVWLSGVMYWSLSGSWGDGVFGPPLLRGPEDHIHLFGGVCGH